MSQDTKPKKKFYKRIWFWILILVLAFGIYAATTGSNKDSSSKDTSSSQSGVTKASYDKIQMGEDRDNVVKDLGKPSTSSKTNTNGTEAELLGWSKVSSSFNVGTISVTVANGKVIGKGYTNPSLAKIKPLDKTKVASIQNGASYKDVIDKLGQPTTEAYTSIAGQNSVMIQYVTSTSGNATSFTFMNDALMSTTETHLN
ncbi:DUF3862 domain-containing protein [Fructilactobacillus sp. Tb1]|uniref:DUF3862 domain-containing protein n=1 Tax=Fructilactobacillus sp. Tb1 TaxID=3422304 RepID=UPI003D29C5BE